ncbi:MAG: Pyrophosphatase PpaX [Chroococcopsis gigantea SAG 12.99]|jgi:phosphoglycolate phosphatase-like HAD superfamily hydrolase|nr:HAD family hydrolase [Chlorogloea purpurea SAG 13.99]MDV2998624.1 Pyrophosphatase PpaX [Chroococcopsis gigantea SAG 12.99]
MLRLITDFDGPIMDVSERYYRVYQYCLEQAQQAGKNLTGLSKEEFWQLKRDCVPERRIGQLSGLDEEQAQVFSSLRRQTVHTLPYLVYDRPLPGAIEVLENIQALGWDLVVMTMRRVSELDLALQQYELGHFFAPDHRYCLSDDYIKTKDIEDKPLLMARALQELPEVGETWMVGDTEADIIAAKTGGLKIIAVLSGIRNRSQLERYEPDFIVNNLAEAVDLITSETLTGVSVAPTIG